VTFQKLLKQLAAPTDPTRSNYRDQAFCCVSRWPAPSRTQLTVSLHWPYRQITNRQKFVTNCENMQFVNVSACCHNSFSLNRLWIFPASELFNLTLQPGLIMPQTYDDLFFLPSLWRFTSLTQLQNRSIQGPIIGSHDPKVSTKY